MTRVQTIGGIPDNEGDVVGTVTDIKEPAPVEVPSMIACYSGPPVKHSDLSSLIISIRDSPKVRLLLRASHGQLGDHPDLRKEEEWKKLPTKINSLPSWLTRELFAV